MAISQSSGPVITTPSWYSLDVDVIHPGPAGSERDFAGLRQLRHSFPHSTTSRHN